MKGTRSPGICHWFRTRAIPRAVARLCLAAMLLNLFVPIAWAAALPPPDPDSVPICHDPAPDEQPAHPASHSNDPRGLIAHCPLCVLFGGTTWAPPTNAAAIIATDRSITVAVPGGADELFLSLPPRLRPNPRAPPALI